MLIKCPVSPTVCCKAIIGTVNSNKLFFFKGSDCNINSERTKDSLEIFFFLILSLTVMLSIDIETMTQRHRVKCYEKSENVTSVGLDVFLDNALSMSYKEVPLTVPHCYRH